MKYKTQDPKFFIETHADDREQVFRPHLVGQSGPVPDDEPLFILRARDLNAVATLEAYLAQADLHNAADEHLEAVRMRINQFHAFAEEYPDRMKIPDTALQDLHDGKPGLA